MTVRHRRGDTPLQFPSVVQALRGFGRAFRLRCPNCGHGSVLTRRGSVRTRCDSCGFRYERTDDNYFGGAVVLGFLMSGGLSALSLLLILLLTWPNPPWDALQYAPLALLLVMPIIIPFSRVLWLTIDVLVRPVMGEELL